MTLADLDFINPTSHQGAGEGIFYLQTMTLNRACTFKRQETVDFLSTNYTNVTNAQSGAGALFTASVALSDADCAV